VLLPDGAAEGQGTGRLVRGFSLLATLCVVLIVAICLVVQVGGWWLGWPPARSILPGTEEMKPEGTFGFLAAAAGFWLLRPGSRHIARRLAGYACALAVIAIGIQDLHDYLTHGLHAVGPRSGGAAAIPTGDADARGPETGLVMSFAGLSLLLRSVRIGRWWPHKLLAVIPTTYGLYGLLSYLLPASRTYWTGQYTAITLGAAACAALLGLALLLAPPEDASRQLLTSEGPAGVHGRRLMAGAISMSVLLGFFSSQADRLNVPLDQRGAIVSAASVIILWLLVGSFVGALQRNVQERRSAERAAASSRQDSLRMEREAQAIVDSAPDAFVSADARGRVTRWNRRAEELLGWSREEALGRTVNELLVPEYHHADVERMLSGVDPFILGQRREMPAVRKDGTEFAIELEVWRLDAGSESRYNAFITDISERKRLEAALVAARDEALQAAHSKSRFLATMSHEIRTPMNGVIGLTDLLLDTPLNRVQRRYASGIQTASAALLGVINDILDFSRLDAGGVVIEETDFDPSRLVDEVTDVFANTAQDRGLELIGNCDTALPDRLRGDPMRLRQILLNLTSNAVKFTPRGEVIVRVALDTRRAAESADPLTVPVRFEVTDTGIGIDPAQRDRLFEPFVQADASTARDYGGTGLGLSICQRLAEAMGGLIGVDSSPGAGSTFWCAIPLHRATEDAAAPPSKLRDLRVVVVDDNESSRLVLSGQLRAWGMRPTPAGDGEHALEALRAGAAGGAPYDVAIIDMVMPGADGIALGRRIAADPLIPAPHLVLLASSDDPDPDAARAAGFAATITKPVHRSSLYERLVDVITGGADGGRAPAAVQGRAAGGCAPERRPDLGTVLVVEDNEINQAVAAGFLDRLGYRTDLAADGRQALDMIAKNSYSAVLMDCRMPGMNGYQATEELRRREGAGRRTPVIAMTAGALAENRERCIAAGMDDFIAKPICQDALGTVLGRWAPAPRPTASAEHRGSPEHRAPPDRGTPPDRSVSAEQGGPAALASIRRRMDELGTGDPGRDRETFARIAAMFLTRERVEIDRLSACVDRRDAAPIQEMAHGIKGAAANIGAATMARLCAELEAAGRDGRLDRAGELIARLRAEFDRVGAALESVLDLPGSPAGRTAAT
jgi:two-component system sensor histidine kinase/response regulator